MKTEDKVLFTIYNNHVASCGEPPHFDNRKPGKYYGYFQNEHCEQWVFVYDYETEKAVLRGGDVEWERAAEITEAKAPYIMNPSELQWLAACWTAATAFKDYREEKRSESS